MQQRKQFLMSNSMELSANSANTYSTNANVPFFALSIHYKKLAVSLLTKKLRYLKFHLLSSL